jgi:quercetin dioxygenase-like cupin family protein
MAGEAARTPPRERFAGPARVMDLLKLANELRAEASDVAGHRQRVIYKHGPLTAALFVFEPGGVLREHRAKGTVTIQGVAGEVEVGVGAENYKVGAGVMVTLAPDVPHDVRSEAGGVMVLHVGLEESAAGVRP